MKIFIITHKKFKNVVKKEAYIPLLVGADWNEGEECYLKDNSIVDNISNKNRSFCELTGAYWIWKAVDEDIVGLCHYRRYFCKTKKVFQKQTILKESSISNILSNYDIVLPSKGHYEYEDKTAREFFAQQHDIEVWEKCKKIISEQTPEYLPDFEWFENEKSGYCYNMMITNKKLFDEYHEWLFQILFKLESVTDISKYNNYNARMYGFVSERLVNVWVHHHHLKVKEMPVYNTDSHGLLVRLKNKIKKYIS